MLNIDEHTFILHGPINKNTNSHRFPNRLLLYLTIILILVPFLLFISTTNIASNSEYYLFVRRWPPSVCLDHHCIPNAVNMSKWVIHGLWPEYSNNKWPEYCSDKKLDPSKLKTLLPQLKKMWPNLLSGKREISLWQHEWSKHGTCSNLNQFEYFDQTLQLNDLYDVEKSLLEANIEPNTVKPYRKMDFENALSKYLAENSFTINCEQHDGKYFIKEITLCISFSMPNQTTFCTINTDCPDEFYYID